MNMNDCTVYVPILRDKILLINDEGTRKVSIEAFCSRSTQRHIQLSGLEELISSAAKPPFNIK